MIKPSNGQITSAYGARSMGQHAGIDFAAGEGSPILAVASGVVHTAMSGCVLGNQNCNGGAGNFIVIDHENGYYTRYLHLSSLFVKKGERVKAGQKIGAEGNTGFSTGSHLHFEVRKDAGFGVQGSLDPLPYLEGRQVFPASKKKALL